MCVYVVFAVFVRVRVFVSCLYIWALLCLFVGQVLSPCLLVVWCWTSVLLSCIILNIVWYLSVLMLFVCVCCLLCLFDGFIRIRLCCLCVSFSLLLSCSFFLIMFCISCRYCFCLLADYRSLVCLLFGFEHACCFFCPILTIVWCLSALFLFVCVSSVVFVLLFYL